MTDKPDNTYFQALLEEYKSLHNDIQLHIRFRLQIFDLLLIAMGALFPLGLQGESPWPVPQLIYPVIALFLALSWVHQGGIMIKLARYIRDEIESKLPSWAWEQTLAQPGVEASLGVWPARFTIHQQKNLSKTVRVLSTFDVYLISSK